ncbi:MAG TPA: hypothetical protein VG223_15360 [Solirubrobacteraceae bacterium]|jgi:hypothetical protein|nr:hypothetical protein [Solirubrobacteraceae bacterium]
MLRRALLITLAALALAACGRGTDHVPNLRRLPLVSGAKIVTQIRVCDPGASAYCAFDLVVTNSRFHTSQQFLHSERQQLHALGWTGAYAPNGDEHTVDSPGGKLHLTYATGNLDLQGIELGWIKRAHAVALELSKTIFDRTPTLSMLLQFGSTGG